MTIITSHISTSQSEAMGSEHSTHNPSAQRQGSLNQDKSKKQSSHFKRQHTIANPGCGDNTEPEANGRPGSISPGPSVCSDTDLPYISYTVNRPIGDSPKLTNKQIVKTKSSQRRFQPKQTKKSSAHNIVVVKSAASAPNIEQDPDILRLQSIPMFLPIMRATLNLPAARDPEVLERLDPAPLYRLCLRYQTHLTSCSNIVATEQNSLTQKIRETDGDLKRILDHLTDRQRKFSRYAEKFSRIQDVSHQLNKCHLILNQTLERLESLNNFLDIDDRLEPFVWTTG